MKATMLSHTEGVRRPTFVGIPQRAQKTMSRTLVERAPRVAPLRADPSYSPDNGVEVPFKELSPAARKIFKEAQENILALNKSRIRALQELKAANEKIAELERRLEDAGLQLSNLATRRASSETVPEAQSAAEVGPSSAAPPPAARPAAPAAVITLYYETGWNDAFLHFQVDDQPWTSLPGLRMEEDKGDSKGLKTVSVPGERMEFVLTNGIGKYDTPNPFGESNKPKNYSIKSPGTYQLHAGQVRRLS